MSNDERNELIDAFLEAWDEMIRASSKIEDFNFNFKVSISSDNSIAYCLEPFKTFQPNNNVYDGMISQAVYDANTWQRLTDLVAFGYQYKDHTDPKWYALTQIMIWETVDKSNEFYFT